MKLFRIALFATLLSVGIASCGGSKDDPINNITPTPTPSNTTVKVASVAVSSTTVSLTEGDSQTITVTISPSNATDKKYTFSSSDTSIVTIDENGKITAIKAGEATITVTTSDGNKTATCKVTVKEKEIPVESVSLNKTELSLTEEQTETLTATVYPENATNTEVTWTSSDPSIATVDKDGKITAVKEGEVTITVTSSDGNKTATCKVLINAIVLDKKLVKYSVYHGSDFVYERIITYNSDGNIEHIIQNNKSQNGNPRQFYFTYSEKEIAWGNSPGQKNASYLLDNGLIAYSIEIRHIGNDVMSLHYDSNNYVTSSYFESNTSANSYEKEYTWSGGNLIQTIKYSNYYGDKKETWEYSDYIWPKYLIIDGLQIVGGEIHDLWGFLSHTSYRGQHPKNLPKNCIEANISSTGKELSSHEKPFIWTVENGYPVKLDYPSNNVTITFEWEQ